MSAAELKKVAIDPKDNMSRWGVEYFQGLKAGADRGLPAMLEAAIERKYSGSPGEGFFTGGGLHHFGNFSKLDDSKILTVRQALRNSTNLVFVRLMRDVVRYYMFQLPGSSAALLADSDDPRRAEYLARFADREGREFLGKFYNKYKGKTPADAEKALLASFHPTPSRLAATYRTVWPEGTQEQFGAFIKANLPSANEVPSERIAKMYETYAPANMSLADRGYVSSIHPLELWVVGYLRNHEKAGWKEVADASVKERQEVYSWLFNTHRKHAQDKRIAGLIEVEAFLKIHAQWKKMGYPFDSLVPSYATVLGASADRPAALAEMMGIIVNDGLRKPVQRIDSLHFAKGTPYETLVKHAKADEIRAGDFAGRGARGGRGHSRRRLGRHRQARQVGLRCRRRQHHRGGRQDRHRRPALRRLRRRRPADRVALRQPLGDLRLQHRRALLRQHDRLRARSGCGALRLHQRAAGAVAGGAGADADADDRSGSRGQAEARRRCGGCRAAVRRRRESGGRCRQAGSRQGAGCRGSETESREAGCR